MRLIILVLILCCCGCAVVDKAAYVTDRVCMMTPAEQAVLAAKVDKVTFPNVVRVECR